MKRDETQLSPPFVERAKRTEACSSARLCGFVPVSARRESCHDGVAATRPVIWIASARGSLRLASRPVLILRRRYKDRPQDEAGVGSPRSQTSGRARFDSPTLEHGGHWNPAAFRTVRRAGSCHLNPLRARRNPGDVAKPVIVPGSTTPAYTGSGNYVADPSSQVGPTCPAACWTIRQRIVGELVNDPLTNFKASELEHEMCNGPLHKQ